MYVFDCFVYENLFYILIQVRRNSHYPFISPSLTNPWKEIYATSKLDNSFFPEINFVLTKKTNDNFDAENILDSDTENECYEKQTELVDVLKKVGFLKFFLF